MRSFSDQEPGCSKIHTFFNRLSFPMATSRILRSTNRDLLIVDYAIVRQLSSLTTERFWFTIRFELSVAKCKISDAFGQLYTMESTVCRVDTSTDSTSTLGAALRPATLNCILHRKLHSNLEAP